MSNARHIREARRTCGWPIGYQDPDEDDDEEEPVEASDNYEIEPEYVDDDAYAAAQAEDRWIAERDRTASQ
jgi:hypothetical protein